MEVLAAVFLTDGRFQESRDSSDKAIALLDSTVDRAAISVKHDDDPKVASALSSLLIMRGEANQRLEAHDQARQDFREAAALLQQMIAGRPDDMSLKFTAGNNLRTFASYLNDRATTDSERQEALSIVSQSISYMESAGQNEMDPFRYLSTLAWSYYDRSFVLEALGRLDDAISDMRKSVDLTEKLTERFPLMNSGRQRLPGVLARRCRLFLKAGRIMSAYTDARNLSDLKLTRDECSMTIELIQRCLDADQSDGEVDRVDAICHIAHLHAQRGHLYRSEGDVEKALTDVEEAIRQMASLAESPVPILYQSLEYLWSLERIEILLLLGRFDKARPFTDEASNRRDAVRNLYDDNQLKAIDRQLESFRVQLKPLE
jgi:tetratricopeptide (TPR) repeat protein